MAFYQDVENTGMEVFRELIDKEAPPWVEKWEDQMKLYRVELEEWSKYTSTPPARNPLDELD